MTLHTACSETLACRPQAHESEPESVHLIVADRMIAKNQIPLLTASGTLTNRAIMSMEMRCAISNGVLQTHMPLKPLVQIASLRNIDRNPTPFRVLFGIDKIARQ